MSNRKIRFSVQAKVVALALCVLVMASGVNVWQSYQSAVADAGYKSAARLSSNIAVAWRVLNPEGQAFEVVDSELRLGGRSLNGDTEIVDQIESLLGGAVTLFLGDTRVSTSLRNPDGSRAVGTKLTSTGAAETTLRGGQPFRGEADILGKPYYVAYDPLKDQQGRTIGLLLVGLDRTAYLAGITSTVRTMIMTNLAIAAVAAVAIFFLTGIMFRPLRALKITFARMAEGDLSHSIAAPRSHDEIGDLQLAVAAMSRNLTQTIANLRRSSIQVASGSTQSAATAEQLSAGSTEQAAASEQASAAVEQMSANIRQNADNAAQTETIAARAAADAGTTGEAVQQSTQAMTHTGITLTLIRGGKHPALVLDNGTRTVKMPFSCTPRSDDKCVANYARQGVRRALQQLAA